MASQEVKVVRLEDFPDLNDELILPRLSERKMKWMRKVGAEDGHFEPGEILYEHGQRDTPFFVLRTGRVALVERKPGKDIHIAEADAPTFLGDIAIFTGEPTISACIATEPTDVLILKQDCLRAMVARWPEFGEHVFETMLARRAWHEEQGNGVLRLIADRSSRRAFEVRDLLERNLLPVKWYDVDNDPESEKMLNWLGVPKEETPVLVHAREVMQNPSTAQVARTLHLRQEVDGERFDLVVLGGGPAGLAAAVYGGSEGLSTFVAESWAPGGQAGTSTRIENYLGFPAGLTGRELTTRATLQARRFNAKISSFHRAVELANGPEGLVRVDLDDGQYVLARSLVMATGAEWRLLNAEGIDRFMGAGVYHAAMPADAARAAGQTVVVIGGGNSAGQAAAHMATRAKCVKVVIRGEALASTMSSYLVDRLEKAKNIEILTETEVVSVNGEGTVDSVTLRDNRDGSQTNVDCVAVYVMIGAEPCTQASSSMLAADPAGYLLCGEGAADCNGRFSWPLSDRRPHLLETVHPGIFAVGDVRAGASKRVAGAVGDGAMSVRFAHQVLDA
jgi:thioredoxin reductase (NADPH)